MKAIIYFITALMMAIMSYEAPTEIRKELLKFGFSMFFVLASTELAGMMTKDEEKNKEKTKTGEKV